MGIVARLAGRKLSAQQQVTAGGLTAMSPELLRWLSNVSSSGKAVNEQSMLGISAAWCCRRILAESIGMLPWSMFTKDSKGNAEKADDHWLQDVLVYSPNREQTSNEFRETGAMGLTGDGNAYSLIERAGKRITSLTPLFGIEPMRKNGSNTKLALRDGDIFFRWSDGGVPEDFPREKIWHLKGFGSNPLKGLSPIGAAREALGGALAMEEFANRFFSQGGMPAGTVSYPGWLTPEQREVARDGLQRMIGGLGNAHKFALFEGGVKPEPWNTMNLEEMQFIFARRFSVLEICRFYRVPPHMVAELEKGASYASIEQMSQEFVMFTLMPYITRIEASVSKWLLPVEERRKVYLRFNYEGLLRADSKGRAEMYASAVQNGWLNRNEVRGKENLNHVDGLDGFTAQTNLASVEKIVESSAAQAQTAPPPAKAEPPRTLILNVLPERAVSVTHKAGDVTVHPAEVHGGNVTVQPAQVEVHTPGVSVTAPTVNVEAPEIRSGDVHVSNAGMAEVVVMLAELVEGLRDSQEANRKVAERLLEKE